MNTRASFRFSAAFLPFLAIISIALIALGSARTARSASAGSAQTIEPAELVELLQAPGGHPLIFQVGFRVLYEQAHIPGSEYLSAASEDAGRAQLRKRVEHLSRDKFIVIYCGCCPWSHCPNVQPAYRELQAMGFRKVKILYIANNFGADWVDKGYPVSRSN